MCLFLTKIQAQVVQVTVLDAIDWNHLPEKYENSKFCVVDGATGDLMELKAFNRGRKHGLFLSFVELYGKRFFTEKNYKKGVLHGYYKGLEESGFYKSGKKNAQWEYHNEAGFYEKVSYKNGIKEGAFYSSEGAFNITGFYKKGKKHKTWRYYEDDDNYKKITYKKGKKHGASFFRINENTEQTTFYKNDEKHGRYYATDGIHEEIGYYKHGEKHGEWITRVINGEEKDWTIKKFEKGVLMQTLKGAKVF